MFDIVQQIQNIFSSPSFVTNYSESLKHLIEWKIGRYRELRNNTLASLWEKELENVNEASVIKRLDAVIVRFQRISNHRDVCLRIMLLLFALSYSERIFTEQEQNFVIYGPLRSGKTYVANVITEIFAQAGIILDGRGGELKEPRSNSVEDYTRQLYQTNEIIIIDEVYPETDELTDAVCNMIDIYKGLRHTIVVDYTRVAFLSKNDELKNRFTHVIRSKS